jgi:uncharacterized membrane protein YfcA
VSAVELSVVAGAVFFASFVQVLAGFGFGLLSVPVMTLAISPREAVVVSTLVGITVTTWQAWHFRRDAVLPLSRRMVAAAYAGMPLGLWVFVSVGEDTLRIVLGSAILVSVVLLARGLNLHHVGPALDVSAGFISGVLNTSVSTNGPPLVFTLQARQLPPAAFRATIVRVFAWSAIAALVLFVAAGKVTHDGLVAAGFALPAMWLGQLAGFPFRRHFHAARFRVLVLVLLALAAVSTIVAALR